MVDEVSLFVNEAPIHLDDFARGFVNHTLGGMVAALKGMGKIETLNVTIEADRVEIILNNTLVATKPFVSKIMKNTLVGLVSSLKGVNEINKIRISIRRAPGANQS